MTTWKAVLVDLLKIIPSLTWLIECLVAIPSYARVGWVAPVVCAVYSALVSILVTIDIFRNHATTLNEYLPLLKSDLPVGTGTEAKDSSSLVVVRIKLVVATGSVFLSVFFAIFFPC